MENFFYTVTPELKEKLERIKSIHDSITLTLITPKDEIKAYWEATVRRITHAIVASGTHTTKHSVIKLLRPTKTKKNTNEEKMVLGYKHAFDYARQEWYGSEKRFTEHVLKTVVGFYKKPDLSMTHEKIDNLLSFVQIQSEHPIVQASLSHALIEINQPFYDGNDHLAIILPYLFLYKHGFYFRGMLDIEEYRIEQKHNYSEYIKIMKNTNNISGMIEFYTNAILYHAEALEKKLKEKSFETDQPESFFQITDRQKQILALFDEPGLRLTNRKVQELFGVSQITASRDLAKLAELGLLFSSGKGRSVFYTKI